MRTDLEETKAWPQAAAFQERLRYTRLLRMRLWQDEEAQLTSQLRAFIESLAHQPKGYFEARCVLPGVRLAMGTDVMEFTSPIDRFSRGAVPREAN